MYLFLFYVNIVTKIQVLNKRNLKLKLKAVFNQKFSVGDMIEFLEANPIFKYNRPALAIISLGYLLSLILVGLIKFPSQK